MTQSVHDLLLDQDLIADGAVLALGQAGLGAGGSLGLVDDLGVTQSVHDLLLDQDLAAGGAVLALGQAGLGAGGSLGFVDDLGVLGSDNHVGAVTDADAGEGALGSVEGVVVGSDTGDGDLVADDQVGHFLAGGDVAVDEHTGDIAVSVLDHDGLHQAVGQLIAFHGALDGDQLTNDRQIVDLLGGDFLGLHAALADDLDGGHLQLHLTLIELSGAGDTDLIADLEVAGHGEAADAAGGVLNVDAVEESGILVIAGGVGGDHAFDGVLVTDLGLGLDLCDGRDDSGVDHCQQVLADLVVGVVLLAAAVLDGGLHLEVGHEGGAGDDDQAAAFQLLGGHDHQTVVALGIGVLGHAAAAQAVLIHVHAVGAAVAEDHGLHGGGQGRGNGVHAGAAVVAEHLGVQAVMGMCGIHFHALGQEAVAVGVEVQTICLAAVVVVIVGGVIADTQAGAQGLQNGVLGGGHMLLGLHVLDGGYVGIVLVVIGPTGQDHHAAGLVEGVDGGQLLSGVDLQRIGSLCLGAAAGGSGQDQSLVLGIGAGSDQVGALVQSHGADAVLGSQSAEVAHAVLIVAVDVLVVVGSVDADVHQLVSVLNIQLDVHGEGVFLAVQLHHGGDGHGHDTGGGGRVVEGHGLGAAGVQSVAGGVGADDLAALDGVGQALDRGVSALGVEQSGVDGQLLIGDGGGGGAFHAGDTQLQAFAHPHGSGHGQVAVTLSDTDVVVAVGGIQRHAQLAGGQSGGIVPGVSHLTGVDDDFHLADGVGLIGIVNGDIDVQLLGHLGDAGAQQQTVDGVADLQVLILGGVHTHVTDGLIDAFLAEVVGQDHVTGVVGVAPLTLVVVLVVGGSHVPALIQSHGVVLIAGIVAACAHLALAVTDLHHLDAGIHHGIPVGEIREGTEGRAGVVELAQGVHTLGLAQQSVVGLHAGVAGLVVQRGVVAGDDTGGVEGVDVAGAAGPGHFKAADGDHVALAGVEVGDGALILAPQLLAVGGGLAHVVQSGLGVGGAGGVKVVGVVGEGHEVHVGAVGQVLDVVQSGLQRTGTVGIGGVGVQLAEVQLVLGLTHGEAPGLGGFLAVGADHGDGDAGAAVSHVGGGDVGQHAVSEGGFHRLAVDGHGDGGAFLGIADLGRDHGTLVLQRLDTGGGSDDTDGGLVLHADLGAAGDVHTLGVHAGNGDLQLFAGDLLGGHGVAAVLACGHGLAVDGHIQSAVHAEHGVHGDGEGVVHTHIGIGEGTEVHNGHVDDAIIDVHAVGKAVEVELIDGGVSSAAILVGGIEAIGLVAVGVVLQVLGGGAVVLGGTAEHLVAAGQGLQRPVGILGCGLGVEGVVAGAVGAQIAVGLVDETEVVAVLFHGEHHAAVGGAGLTVFDLSHHVVDALGVVLGSQHALGVLVVDDDLAACGGQTAGGDSLSGGELQGEHALGAAVDVIVAAPVVLAGIPLDVAAAGCVLHVEQAVAGIFQRPGGVHIVQRHGGVAGTHGQLLAVGGGNGDGAVVAVLDGPDLGGGVAGQLVAAEGDGGAGVIVAAVVGGQSHVVGGSPDHIVTVGNGVLGSGLDQIQLHLIDGSLLDAVGGEAGVIFQCLVVVAVVVGAHVLDVPGAVGGDFHGPLAAVGQLLGEGQAVAGGAGGQVLAVQGEDVLAILVDGDQQLSHAVSDGQLALGNFGSHGSQLLAAGGGAHGVAGVVDDDDVAVIGQRRHLGGNGDFGIGSLAALTGGIDNQIQLIFISGTGAGVAAEIIIGFGTPLQLLTAAAHIFDGVETFLAGDGNDVPGVVNLVKGGAAETRIHGEFLAVGGSNGVAAISSLGKYPDLRVGIAGQNTVGNSAVHTAVIIAAAIAGVLGQNLAVGGVEDDYLIAGLQSAQVGDKAALALNGGGNLGELVSHGVAQLQRGVVHAHGGLDVQLVTHLYIPSTVGLAHHSLVQLNGVGAVGDGDVGGGVGAVVVKDLGDLHTLEGDVGADVCDGQGTDGGLLGSEGHAGGLFIGAAAQLGQTVVHGLCTGTDDGVTQSQIGEVGTHAHADAAGGILQIDVFAVQQSDHALDGELGTVSTGQSGGDGDDGGLRLGSRAAGRGVLRLVQSDSLLVGVRAGLVVAEAHLISVGVETHVCAAAELQIHTVSSDGRSDGIFGCSSLVVGRGELVGIGAVIQVLAAGGLENIAAGDSLQIHCDAVVSHGDGIVGNRDVLIVVRCVRSSQTAVEHLAACLVDQQIFAGPVSGSFRDLGVRYRVCGEGGGGDQAEHHDQRHHERRNSAA